MVPRHRRHGDPLVRNAQRRAGGLHRAIGAGRPRVRGLEVHGEPRATGRGRTASRAQPRRDRAQRGPARGRGGRRRCSTGSRVPARRGGASAGRSAPARAGRPRARAPRHPRDRRARLARRGRAAGAGGDGARAAAPRAPADGRRRRPLRAARARAAGHDRRRAGPGSVGRESTARGRSTSSAWARCARGDPLEVLRLEIEAARSGLEAPDRSEELARLAGTGEAVSVGGRAPAVVHARRCSTKRARLLMRSPPGRTPRPQHRGGARARAPGWTPVGRPRCWRRWPPRVELERRDGGYVRAGAQAHPRRPARAGAAATPWRATACSPGRSWHSPPRAGVSAGGGARGRSTGLAARGEVVRAKPGIYYHPDAVEQARAEVVGLCEQRGGRDDRAPARSAGDRPQARAGPARAPRRDPRHPPRRRIEHVLRRSR